MELTWPSAERLGSYREAVERGWSPDNLRPTGAQEEIERIVRDPKQFVAEQVDPHGTGPRIVLPDGSTVPRLPGYHRWIWDGEFCGVIDFRWKPGTPELPPTCLGHIGYSVVPWKRGRGYATRALGLLLPDVRRTGLPYVELTTDEDNVASRNHRGKWRRVTRAIQQASGFGRRAEPPLSDPLGRRDRRTNAE